jgi:hypothetical protein
MFQDLTGDITTLLRTLQESELSMFIQQSPYAFPSVETLHVIALTLVIGSIWLVDLRLLGLAATERPVTEVCARILPLTWGAFVAATIAGLLLFITQAIDYYENTSFRIKVLMMALAGLNMLHFQHLIYRDVADWNRGPRIPIMAKAAAALSLMIWIAVMFCGRLVAFTMLPS